MRNHICLLFALVFCSVSEAQNLIENPSFENYKKLPTGTSQWNLMENWTNPQHGTGMKNPGSPDFYHLDSKGGNSQLPSPAWVDGEGIEVYPKEGSAVAGIIGCSNSDLHEYITIALNRKVAIGERIKISFYYTNGAKRSVGTKITKLGTYFSVAYPNSSQNRMNVIPQTEMKATFSKDWALYEGEFVATEEYQYMTIGGFRGPEDESFQVGTDNGMFGDWAYYFIDGVTVEKTGTETFLPEEKKAGIKFIFKSEDDQTLIKVKGEFIINDNQIKQKFEDSVFIVKEKTPTKITISASAPGYFSWTKTLEGERIPVENSNRIIHLKPITKGSTIVLENILFNAGSPVILPSSHDELNKLVTFLNENPQTEILISGHTDNRGNAEIDLELSKKRAVNVMNYLIQHGISGKRITAKGFGMTKPIADNNTEEGRAKNRRVEFSIVK
jgi:outer membrane protein OmpA-like peptidoglycan-associated protein